MTPQILAVAHRGYSARYPENTVAGALAAIEAGADLVEADVRFSSDGRLFCFHDPDLSRLTGRQVAVAECSSEQLRGPRLDGGSSASFDQILAVVAGRAGLLVDVKLRGNDVLVALHEALAAAGWPKGVWLGLRDVVQVGAARTLFGDRVSILALMPGLDRADAFSAAGADALRIWEADVASPQARDLKTRTSVWITAGACRGLEVGDTDAEGLCLMRAFGPAGILLNDPTLLAKAPA